VRPPVTAGNIINFKFSTKPSDIGTKPRDGNHCSVNEKTKIRIIPTTKPGIESPIDVEYPITRSTIEPGFSVESGARIKARTTAMRIMKKVSSNVTGILSDTSWVTGN
jgi:hypothetical protein